MDSRSENVEIHIEELVLHGLERIDASTLATGLKQQLTRLLVERPLPQTSTRSERIVQVESGKLGHSGDASAAATGRAVAEAIHKGLCQ